MTQNKTNVPKRKKLNYNQMVEILRPYLGQVITTEKVKEMFKDYYSPLTHVNDYTFVTRGILKKCGWGIYLVNIPLLNLNLPSNMPKQMIPNK